MAAITTRATAGAGATVKGSNLTNAEVDANLINLNDELFVDALPVIRPTLSLDFLNQNALDERVTFSRSSSGTYTDSAGLLRRAGNNVPRFDFDPATGEPRGLLVEEQRTNILLWSDRLDVDGGTQVGLWSANAGGTAVTPNAAVAPDGSVSADLIADNPASGNSPWLLQTYSGAPGTTYTFSCYVRSAGDTTFNLWMYDDVAGGQRTSVTVTSAWQRVSATRTIPAGATLTRVGFDGYTTAGVYIWGAQLEVGAFATSYIPSSVTFTGRASTATLIGSNGLIQTAASGVARQQYNPLNLNADPFLLLEAAATNRLLWSEDFSSVAVWGRSNITVTANAAVAPDGTTTADRVEASGSNYILQSTGSLNGTNVTVSASIFIKNDNYGASDTMNINVSDGIAGNFTTVFRPVDGVVTSTFTSAGTWTGIARSVEALGNGWYRVKITGTTTQWGSGWLELTFPVGKGAFLWGAQLEAGSFPTSYIPTTTAQVTRAADTSTSAQTTRAVDRPTASLTPWFNAAQGSWYVESAAINTEVGSTSTQIAVSAGAAYVLGNGMLLRYSGGVLVEFGGTQSAVARNVNAAGVVNRIGASYQGINASLVANGGAVGAISTMDFTGSGSTTLLIGALRTDGLQQGSLRLRKLTYYPKRLTDTELRALTL